MNNIIEVLGAAACMEWLIELGCGQLPFHALLSPFVVFLYWVYTVLSKQNGHLRTLPISILTHGACAEGVIMESLCVLLV